MNKVLLASIFLLCAIKSSTFWCLVYFVFVIYLVMTSVSASQMKTVAYFIVFATLCQNLLINAQQPISTVKGIGKNDMICNPKTTLLTKAGFDLTDSTWAIHFGLEIDPTSNLLRREL